MEVILQRSVSNIPLLDEELRAALGDAFVGISIKRAGGVDTVSAHLRAEATAAQIKQAQQLIQGHDARQRTRQQQQADEQFARLQAGRAAYQQPLSKVDFNNQTLLVQLLAARLAWLEEEIRDLRGLAG